VARPLSAEQVVLIGVRDFDPPEADYVRGRDIRVFGDDVFRKPTALVDLLRQRGFRHAYVHFDVDVLNPAHCPAALMQAPGGGPTLDEAIALIAAVQAAVDGVGLSVLEFCARDAAWTARLASAVRSVVW
jgi:arginase